MPGGNRLTKVEIGSDSEFGEGQMKAVSAGGRPLIVARVDGTLYAMDGRCSHMGFDLSKGRIEGPLVTCRLHGAQFDIRSGEVLRNMSAKKMNTYPVSVENGKVFVDV